MDELAAVQRKLDEVHCCSMEETPGLLAAIDEGIRSAEEEPLIPIEEVMKGLAVRYQIQISFKANRD